MPTTVTYTTAGPHTFVVPDGVTLLAVVLDGASGGGDLGGRAGQVMGTLSVTPGETLRVYCGRRGTATGGGNGGGNGSGNGYGGGGATDIRRGGTGLSHRVAVAAGGGGASASTFGGAGGATSGEAGGGANGGGGATQTAGGARGSSIATDGTSGVGGNGSGNGGGGGGGGWYGGGGGHNGGGGGSNRVGSLTSASSLRGVGSSHGRAELTYNRPPDAPTLNTPTAGADLDPRDLHTFTWTHSDPDGDPQAQAQIAWRQGTSGSGTVRTFNGWSDSATYQQDTFPTGQLQWRVRTADSEGYGPWSSWRSFTSAYVAPLAPTLTAPTSGATLSRGDTTRFRWTHRHPDNRPQNRYELQHRPSGGTATTLSSTTPNGWRDIAGGSFTVGDNEWRVRTYDGTVWGPWSSWRSFNAIDRPPAAPAQTNPAAGVDVNRAQGVRLAWQHSQPDGNPQSGYELEHRPAGLVEPVRLTDTTTNQYRDLPGGTFGAGGHEWRVRTRDSQGTLGAWSGWRGLTAVDPPGDVTILSPPDGATVAANPTALTWSVPTQDAYRVAAEPLEGALWEYFSGVVESSSARSHPIPVVVTATQEWSVQVRRNGIWSPWTSITVSTNPTLPATPDIAIDDRTTRRAIRIQASHPEPVGDQPAVETVEIWRREELPAELGGGTSTPVRIAAGLTPGDVHIDRTVAAGTEYDYRVVAVATTGASAASVWHDGTTVIEGDGQRWGVTVDRGRLVTSPADGPARVLRVDGWKVGADDDGRLTTEREDN